MERSPKALKFPATSNEMKEAGYVYDNDGVCRGCQRPIEWWITPAGKKMPISVLKTATIHVASGDVRQPHFTDCEKVSDFRRPKS
jgi:hypothetical protein